jgi:hypothetical protein
MRRVDCLHPAGCLVFQPGDEQSHPDLRAPRLRPVLAATFLPGFSTFPVVAWVIPCDLEVLDPDHVEPASEVRADFSTSPCAGRLAFKRRSASSLSCGRGSSCRDPSAPEGPQGLRGGLRRGDRRFPCPHRHTEEGARADSGRTALGASAASGRHPALDIRLCSGGSGTGKPHREDHARTLALAGGASPPWARDATQVIATTIPGAEHCVHEGQGG